MPGGLVRASDRRAGVAPGRVRAATAGMACRDARSRSGVVYAAVRAAACAAILVLATAAPVSVAAADTAAAADAAVGAAPPAPGAAAAAAVVPGDPGVGHAVAAGAGVVHDSDGSAFFSAFTQSFLLILACELGDRTFFVAAILAMKAARVVVFAGAMTALAVMTVLSALMGFAFPRLVDKKYTSMAAALLFAYFGFKLLRSWWGMRKEEVQENEELAEVEEELNSDKDGTIRKSMSRTGLGALLSPVFIKAFSMTALAEWGDRSQIATIALAAQQDVTGVVIGGIAGHAICTSLAVVGGRLLATRISEKAVSLTGGLLFISFAVLTATGMVE